MGENSSKMSHFPFIIVFKEIFNFSGFSGVLSFFFVQANSFKNKRFTIIDRNVNFVGEVSSRAHFKDNFILIKD